MGNWVRASSRLSGWLAPISADGFSAIGKEPITIGLLAHPGAPGMAKSVSGSAIITHMKSVAWKVPNGGPDYMTRVPEFFP
jgi:hypothetical protein